MSIPGYVDYQRRAYCKDIQCPVQLDLDAAPEGSSRYEQIKNICKTNCRMSAYDFHHWLMQKGYSVVKVE